MTLDYESRPPPTRRLPTLREVGRSLIAFGAIQWFPLVAYALVQTYERHPRWPSAVGWVFFACCFVSGLIQIVCGLIIRRRLVPAARWSATVAGAALCVAIAWVITMMALELQSGSGPAQKGAPFLVGFILLGFGVIGVFGVICRQMHLIARNARLAGDR